MSIHLKTLVVLMSTVLVFGCATKKPESAATPEAPVRSGAADGSAQTRGVTDGGAISGDAVTSDSAQGAILGDSSDDGVQLPGMPAKRTVYFDFDKSDITAETRAVIEQHAKYLAGNGKARVKLEGHCDERGSREYNLGLGERRAKAVQQVLTLLGVSASQIETVSYGEERPAAEGHDESAWSLNRRVEFIYVAG